MLEVSAHNVRVRGTPQQRVVSALRLQRSGEDWHDEAACRSLPAILFFGGEEGEASHERRAREERAKFVCRSCSVRAECLDYALSTEEKFGIWGGLTEIERRRLPAVAR